MFLNNWLENSSFLPNTHSTWISTNIKGQPWYRTAKGFHFIHGIVQKVTIDMPLARMDLPILNCSEIQRNYISLCIVRWFPQNIFSCPIQCHPDTLWLQRMTYKWPPPSYTHKSPGDPWYMQKMKRNWFFWQYPSEKYIFLGNYPVLETISSYDPMRSESLPLGLRSLAPILNFMTSFSGIHSSLWKHKIPLDNVPFSRKDPTQRSWLKSWINAGRMRALRKHPQNDTCMRC